MHFASSHSLRGSGGTGLDGFVTAALRVVGAAIFALRLHPVVIRLSRARPKVLCYHAIEPHESDFTRGLRTTISPAAFAVHLRFLGRYYRVVALADVERGMAGERAVAITFDDGYRSVLTHAVPRLAERRWPSTHYLVTDAVGNRAMVWVNELTWFLWNHPIATSAALKRIFGLSPEMSVDRVISAIRERYDSTAVAKLLETLRASTGVDATSVARHAQLYMDWDDVATMHATGIAFGNHTATHPSLPRLDEEAQRHDIERGRVALEQRVGRVTSLAVPFGDVDDTTRRLAAESGHASIAEVGGVNDSTDRTRLARVVVTARSEAELFAEMEVVTPARAWLKARWRRGERTATGDENRPGDRRRLRVLYVWFSEYPWDVRAEKICGALTAAGHEVHLVARNRRGEAPRSLLPEATVHRIAPWLPIGRRFDAALQFPMFLNPRWTRLLDRVAREARPDVIIARDLPLCPAAIRLGRRLGIPVVLDMAENYPAFMRVMRDAGHHGLLDRLVRSPRVLAAVERDCLMRVDRVLTVVEESAARVARLGVPAERIRIVSNTPPRARAERTLAAERARRVERLEVVYLGLLEVPRGIDELIDAAVLLRDSETPFRVTLVGDGRDAPRFRARARAAGLTERELVFAGHLPLRAALDVVAAADIGVVPLRRCEAYDTTVPNKLFDYMAHGLAVATSDTRPSARIIRETGAGAVFRAGDASDLAATLRRLSDPALRRAAGDAGRRAVLERYNWERDAATLRHTVEELAGVHGAAVPDHGPGQ